MHVAWPATSGADREFSREVRFCSGSESGGLFVPYMNPLNLLLPANRIGHSVERIARDAINSRYSSFSENINQQVRYFFPSHPMLLGDLRFESRRLNAYSRNHS